MAQGIPGWVSSTPQPSDEYSLTMMADGISVQIVTVTRHEFIALKSHLAALRGHGSKEKREDRIVTLLTHTHQ